MVKCRQPFLIIVHSNNEEQAVAATIEKELPNQPEENYRFRLEQPDWSRPTQQFRFGEGNESDILFSVWKPKQVLDQAYSLTGRPFQLWPKNGAPSQRFEYRPSDRRLICKAQGDAVTRTTGVPPLIAKPCNAEHATNQHVELRFRIPDISAILRSQ
jgi:hypothetical protein